MESYSIMNIHLNKSILFNRKVYFPLFLILFFSLSCSEKQPVREENDHYLNHNDTVKYIGKEKCIICHYDHYETYQHTGMGLSYNKATLKKSASILGKDSILYDQYRNLYYHPYWKDSIMYIDEYRLDGKDTIHKRTQEITHIVGSGQHTNSHMYDINGYFYQIPFTFYTQDGLLDFPPGFENGENNRFSRIIALECISCHNNLPKMVLGSENKYTEMPSGIDCERCHGPGEVHYNRMTANQVVDTSKRPDYSIVNPSRLSSKLVNDLCARCHLQGTTVLKEGKNYYDFKPGMKMTDVMDVFQPWYEGGKESYIMASHYERMVLSSCYLKSKQELTCIACHNPHISHTVTPSSTFNKVCTDCHDNQKLSYCSLPEKERGQNNCVECHMPLTSSTDIPHVKIHDHRIRIPQTDSSLNTTRVFKGLKAFNNWNTDSLSMAMGYLREYESYTREPSYLDSAFAYLEQYQGSSSSYIFKVWIDYYFLKKDYPALIHFVEKTGIKKVLYNFLIQQNYNNYDGWAAYRIGQAYDSQNRPSLALQFYKKAIKLIPFNLEFQNKYGTILVKQHQLAEAKKVFEFAISENPLLAISYLNLGYLYAIEKQLNKAKTNYQKAIQLNPDYLQALINLAGVYYMEGNKAEAKKLLQRAQKLEPNNARVHIMLSELEQ